MKLALVMTWTTIHEILEETQHGHACTKCVTLEGGLAAGKPAGLLVAIMVTYQNRASTGRLSSVPISAVFLIHSSISASGKWQ
jgi:hypothetical protein